MRLTDLARFSGPMLAAGVAAIASAQPAVTAKREVPQTPLPVRGGSPGEIAILATCGKFLAHPKAGVNALAWSPDGRLLAAGFNDGTVKLWSMPEGAFKATLEGHKRAVRSLAFSPDGRMLASGSEDRTIRLWTMPDASLKATLEGQDGAVDTLAFSPDGRLLGSGSDVGKSVILWSMPDGAVVAKHVGGAKASLFLADGQYLTASSPPMSVRLWSRPDGATSREFRKPGEGQINALTASPDGRTLVSGGSDRQRGAVQLWSMPDGKPGATLLGHFNIVTGLAYSPDGGVLVSASVDQSVKLWSMPQSVLKATLSGHLQGAFSVAFSPDGRTLAVGGGMDKGSLHLWSMPDSSSTACLFDPTPAP